MDFKTFCVDENKHINDIKQYKDILEKVIDIQKQPKFYHHRVHKPLIKNKSFFGNPDEPEKNQFKYFNCPSYSSHEPYEEYSGVSTYCEKCEGRLSKEFLVYNRSNVKRKPSAKKPIPEHLMGRVVRHTSDSEDSSESDESSDSLDPKMLYKITIKTNDQQGSGTCAPVCIRLVGNVKKSESINLSKKCGSLKFAFAPGSKEIFHVRAILLPSLKGVNIKLDAKEAIDEWCVDWLSIEELSGEKRKWFCNISRWLSCWREKCFLIAKLKPEAQIIPNIVYSVKLTAANDSVDEFCGNLSIQLHGSERKSNSIFLLVNKKSKIIKKGTQATYEIKSSEVGKLKAIRITVEESLEPHVFENQKEAKPNMSDGKKMRSVTPTEDKKKGANKQDVSEKKLRSATPTEEKRKGWEDIKIDRISVHWKGSDKKEHNIEFKVDDWIGISHKMKRKSMFLNKPIDLGKQLKLSRKQENCLYDVTFFTGKKTFSGTDATVYVKFYGSYGIWSKTYEFVDYDKKRFESGKEDTFRINGPGVGSIEKINISHSNTGVASGWKLDKVTVVRQLTSSEICDALQDLKSRSSLPKEFVVKDGKVSKNEEIANSSPAMDKTKNKENSRNKSSSGNTDSDTSSDSISDSIVESKKHHAKDKDESKYIDSLVTRLPYAEESSFICKKWLSEKDGEKSLNKIIDADSRVLLFSPISLLLNQEN